MNDTMLVIWERANSYNGASKVSPWIFAIAYRKALSRQRRRDEPVDDLVPRREGYAPGLGLRDVKDPQAAPRRANVLTWI